VQRWKFPTPQKTHPISHATHLTKPRPSKQTHTGALFWLAGMKVCCRVWR